MFSLRFTAKLPCIRSKHEQPRIVDVWCNYVCDHMNITSTYDCEHMTIATQDCEHMNIASTCDCDHMNIASTYDCERMNIRICLWPVSMITATHALYSTCDAINSSYAWLSTTGRAMYNMHACDRNKTHSSCEPASLLITKHRSTSSRWSQNTRLQPCVITQTPTMDKVGSCKHNINYSHECDHTTKWC